MARPSGEKLLAATALARQLLTACAAQLLAAGIPVQPDRVREISLLTLRRTRAICRYHREADGQLTFAIGLSRQFARHMDDPRVVSHVRNSIFHELLHTCPDGQSHGAVWMHWSAVCDRALGTATRRHMESPIYYNTLRSPPVVYRCPRCDGSYHAVKPLEDVSCQLCGADMTEISPKGE